LVKLGEEEILLNEKVGEEAMNREGCVCGLWLMIVTMQDLLSLDYRGDISCHPQAVHRSNQTQDPSTR
jgi:hypothetical protein